MCLCIWLSLESPYLDEDIIHSCASASRISLMHTEHSEHTLN